MCLGNEPKLVQASFGLRFLNVWIFTNSADEFWKGYWNKIKSTFLGRRVPQWPGRHPGPSALPSPRATEEGSALALHVHRQTGEEEAAGLPTEMSTWETHRSVQLRTNFHARNQNWEQDSIVHPEQETVESFSLSCLSLSWVVNCRTHLAICSSLFNALQSFCLRN